MLKNIFCSLISAIFLLQIANAQINTPAGATIPFGALIQSDPTPYPFGLIAGNLPGGAYNPASNQYGKSQDAYTGYNSWKTCYAVSCGGSPVQWRIKFDNTNETVSEGIAYGMLLAAYAADKTLFDGLWTYYKAKSNGNGVMNWRISGCGAANGFNGATDAELDAAMALIVAECQWPTATSPYNYSAEAQTLIGRIRQWEIQPAANPPQYQANNGDGWGFGNTCRNPSYQAPAYYRQFQAYDPGAPAGFWSTNCVNASYTLINNNNNNTTGLVSNWSDQNGNPNSCNGPNEYGYDACRNPWRMAKDYIWNGDASALAVNNLVTNWLRLTTANNVRGPVPINAANPTVGSTHNATFVSTWGLSPMGTNNAANQAFLNSMYTETVLVSETQNCSAGGGSGYFGNTLRAIALFMQTGNFWEPCPSILPVNLLNFKASREQGLISLSWQTGSEKDNSHFVVERSLDGINFTEIGTIKGVGNSNTVQSYSFNDENNSSGIAYYRLAQYDFNGSVNYSQIEIIEGIESEIKIYPVPAKEALNIEFFAQVAGEISIKDIYGKTYHTQQTGSGYITSTIDLAGLSSGVYVVQLRVSDGIAISKKFIKE